MLNLITLLFCVMILIAVLNFDSDRSLLPGQVLFEEFWTRRCEKDWNFAFKSYVWGDCLLLSTSSTVVDIKV